MQNAILLSCVTAAIVGYMAYRRSGQLWPGLATALAVFGLVTIVPLIVLSTPGTLRGNEPRALVAADGVSVVYGANVLALAWLVWLRIRRP